MKPLYKCEKCEEGFVCLAKKESDEAKKKKKEKTDDFKELIMLDSSARQIHLCAIYLVISTSQVTLASYLTNFCSY